MIATTVVCISSHTLILRTHWMELSIHWSEMDLLFIKSVMSRWGDCGQISQLRNLSSIPLLQGDASCEVSSFLTRWGRVFVWVLACICVRQIGVIGSSFNGTGYATGGIIPGANLRQISWRQTAEQIVGLPILASLKEVSLRCPDKSVRCHLVLQSVRDSDTWHSSNNMVLFDCLADRFFELIEVHVPCLMHHFCDFRFTGLQSAHSLYFWPKFFPSATHPSSCKVYLSQGILSLWVFTWVDLL